MKYFHHGRLRSQRHRFTALLAAAFVLFATNARAAEPGFYVGGTLGFSDMSDFADAEQGFVYDPSAPADRPVLEAAGIDGIFFQDHDLTIGAYFGYRFNGLIDAELSYADIGSFDSGTPSDPADVGTATMDIKELALGIKLHYPISDDLRPYLYLGVAHADISLSGVTELRIDDANLPPGQAIILREPYVTPDDELSYAWGLGFDWHMSERFALNVAFKRHMTTVIPASTLVVGISLTL